MKPEAITLAHRLKSETAEAHAALEQRLNPRLFSISNKEDYGQILKVFHSFFAPLQHKVQAAVPAVLLPDIAQRRTAHWIEQDLRVLQQNVPPPASEKYLPKINTSARAIGALYVMEGATLGGRIIAKKLTQQLGDEVARALRFFEGYRHNTGPMWVQFVAALNGLTLSETETGQAINAANETFQKFDMWIQQQRP